MTNIIILFQRIEEARGIKSLIVRNGYNVNSVCSQGYQALANADDLGNGIIICGYKYADMIYSELREYLPKGFDMLLIASKGVLGELSDGQTVALEMPLRVQDLIETLEMMTSAQERLRKKARLSPKQRTPEEIAVMNKAKELLMNRNHMTEEEAHRYIQKCSMDSGTNLVETSQMILTIMDM